jgi:hypothetical protein
MIDNWYTDSDPDAETDPQAASSFFREEFEIDLENERYSKVEVPDFKNGRLGRFIHEFDSVRPQLPPMVKHRMFLSLLLILSL